MANPSLQDRHPATQQILKILQSRIEGGQYAPGTWLPTERALADEFDVHRSIVRAALTHLEARGFVVRPPGPPGRGVSW